jgi:predicted nuclease of predicted toxin-antitoxin system
VFSVYDQARGIDDDLVIQMAYQDHGVLITNDKGFGERIVREKHPHHGVILLRLSDETSASKITVLNKVLQRYANQIEDHFIVATDTKIRFSTG